MRSVHAAILFRAAIFSFLLLASSSMFAQDSPGRFEAGGNFTSLRFDGTGFVGPGVDADLNFGRHIAIDGTFSWLPNRFVHTRVGVFGAKVGTRTEHFGFFAKVRPGFISFANVERSATEMITTDPGLMISLSQRFARLTERALDFGGVLEYYPARHWALRWDFGDMVVFPEPNGILTILENGVPHTITVSAFPASTTHNFVFNTAIHYRF